MIVRGRIREFSNQFLFLFVEIMELKNVGNSLHGGATAALVDVVGSSVILTFDRATTTGVSVEINVSYLDAAYVGVCICISSTSIHYYDYDSTLNTFFYDC